MNTPALLVLLPTVFIIGICVGGYLATWYARGESETAKAVADRERELDRRTAQIIRERGLDGVRARGAAVAEYEREMTEATP